jgi:hypothetical protein
VLRLGFETSTSIPMFRRTFTVRTSRPLRSRPILSTAVIPIRHLTLTQSTKMGVNLKGHCVCKALTYSVSLDSPDDARTTLCHCQSCRRAFGTNYGLTTKVPVDAFKYESGKPKLFQQDNGVVREFCDNCRRSLNTRPDITLTWSTGGAYITEYGQEAKHKFRYVMWGTFDEPEKVPPKGEFYCSNKPEWMPPIPGEFRVSKRSRELR